METRGDRKAPSVTLQDSRPCPESTRRQCRGPEVGARESGEQSGECCQGCSLFCSSRERLGGAGREGRAPPQGLLRPIKKFRVLLRTKDGLQVQRQTLADCCLRRVSPDACGEGRAWRQEEHKP